MNVSSIKISLLIELLRYTVVSLVRMKLLEWLVHKYLFCHSSIVVVILKIVLPRTTNNICGVKKKIHLKLSPQT